MIKQRLEEMWWFAGYGVTVMVMEWHRSAFVSGEDNMASFLLTANQREWRLVQMAHHYGNLLQKHPGYSHRIIEAVREKNGRGERDRRVKERNRLNKCSKEEWREEGKETWRLIIRKPQQQNGRTGEREREKKKRIKDSRETEKQLRRREWGHSCEGLAWDSVAERMKRWEA